MSKFIPIKRFSLLLLALFPLLIAAQTPPKKEAGDTEKMYDFDDIPAQQPKPMAQDSPDPDPYETLLMAIEKMPEPANLDQVKGLIGYPPLAREAEIEGEVIVRVLVDKTGHYVKHIVVQDPHPMLTKAVTDKINNISFYPGIQDGKPIVFWLTIPFTFSLNGGSPGYTDLNQDQWIYDALAKTLPFDQPDKLTELNLAGQGLRIFPWRMLVFKNLQTLDLSNNQMHLVMPEVASLKKLETLDLSRNLLEALPKELLKMPSIKSIVVTGNHFPLQLQQSLETEYGSILFPKDNLGKVMW